MEDNEQPPAPIPEASAPQVVERPLWDLSRDEQRVVIITFVGGLASIVAGVCVVGGAIALVRGLRALHYTLSLLFVLTVMTIIPAVQFLYLRHRGVPVPARWPRFFRILWLFICVAGSTVLLAWIGLAAGIH